MNQLSGDGTVQKDLSEFLRSSATNVEWMSDELRTKLHVDTGLEQVVREAIREGRSVVIAGTAGSGKTHLLQSIGAIKGYEVTPDLSALDEEKWSGLFSGKRKVIVAGNEGAFLQGSHKQYKGFREIVDLLHALQNGQSKSGEGPTVIDAAGFDPAGNGVVKELVKLGPLARYAEGLSDLPATAWTMLQNDVVSQRLALLIEVASADSGTDGFTFRQIWQFIAALLEGDQDESSPWYENVFAGKSEISRRISASFQVTALPLPHIGNLLWHGDHQRVRNAFLDCAVPVLDRVMPIMQKEQSDAERLESFKALRMLAAFGLKDSPIDGALHRGNDLWSKVRNGDSDALLSALGHYFAFGLIDFGDDLELWIQHETERREVKPDVQVSLGVARATDFKIQRSVVFANRPKGVEQKVGGRYLLVHDESGASLTVTKDLIDGILRVRSHRTNERRVVEYDWRLGRFFEGIAHTLARPERLKVAKYDFQARKGRLLTWQVSADQIRKVAN
jgi:hypothetical protein